MTGGLAAAAKRLRCPHCGAPLELRGRALACANGHSYDVARQGHVTLLPPRGTPHTGDTKEMVAARERFLNAGHYEPIASALETATREALPADGCVVELGAGTAYYLQRALEDAPSAIGIALDASKHAARAAQRSSPSISAVVCDIWQPLPLRDDSADVVLNVFAPRNATEIARILKPQGALVVVTPTPRHLRELSSIPGMLTVDEAKQDRLEEAFTDRLEQTGEETIEFEMRPALADLIAMGPSARHVDLGALAPAPATVTASITVRVYRA